VTAYVLLSVIDRLLLQILMHDIILAMTTLYNYNPRLVAWLSVGQLISWGSVFYLFTLLMPLAERELAMTRPEASLAFALALGAEGLLSYPVGRLIDAGFERSVMAGGSILLAVCLFLLSITQTQMGFYLCWTGLGIGMACCLYTPVFAVVTRRFPVDFRRAVITMTFLGGLASTLFLPLMAWMFTAWGWRMGVMALASLHLLICLPIHLYWLKNAPAQALSHPDQINTPSTALRSHLTSPQFLWFAVFIVLMMGVTSALPAHMISLLRELDIPEFWVIAIPASIGLLQVFGRLLLYFFEHRVHVNRINQFIPCLLPLGLMALIAANSASRPTNVLAFALLFLFVLIWGMGNGMLTIVKGTAIAQYISREHVAALNGALGIPLASARALAPLTLGLLWSQSSGYSYGLWLLLGLSLAAICALFVAIGYATKRTI
jgi:MFS family permease